MKPFGAAGIKLPELRKRVEKLKKHTIFDAMTRNYVLKFVCLVLVSAILATPVMGAVCSMACGDTKSCCCAGGGNGELAYSAPDCCRSEVQESSAAAVYGDRHYSSFSSFQFTAVTAEQVASLDGLESDKPDTVVSLVDLRPPPSPLYILNASFLI